VKEREMSGSEKMAYEVAVIGMAGRFPGAATLAEFWRNLCAGVEGVSFFSDAKLEADGVAAAALADPAYVKAAAVLDDVGMFDAAFFGFTPREAEVMDPQQRLFLEQAWQALENAGYDAERYAGRVGVFAGVSGNTYLLDNLLPNREALESVGQFQTMISNDRDFLATLVSYKLNLKGPSLTVQTACSTSLVAIHLATQSLLNHECDIAMAGGVSIRLPQKQGYFYQEGGILSPDGHCRAFDAQARGTVSGSGVGVVVLKRLPEALRDRDTILAVIKGSAVNNDGALKVGYTAPSVEGQAAVIEEALAVADVSPETISYVEAHGTATPLGDPVEVAALTRAFGAQIGQNGYCAIGSVKTNIGHLDAAAGVAGFIKTVLALSHQALPPSLHFQKANPQIDFAHSPFYVNDRLREWHASPRRAGVSSFGIGGTNAHVVLEEAPAAEPAPASRPHHLLVLSARTATALETATANLSAYFQQNPEAQLGDVAYTLQMGRRTFAHRRAVVCRDSEEAVAALADPKRRRMAVEERRKRPVAFVFSGQGAQYAQMGRDLYRVEPIFRAQMDRCAELLRPHTGVDLGDLLYGKASSDEGDGQGLEQTAITQPALFAVEWALASLLIAYGVKPQAMLGHSIGEYVAACLAGVLSLEDALLLVAARGRLMQQLPAGAMLAIALSEAEVKPLLANKPIALAAVNAPSLCVVSGPTEAIDQMERQLGSDGVICRRVRTSHAFHSEMMESVRGPFREQVNQVSLSAPNLPYLSNVTGRWISAAEATSPDYWANHLRETVRFQKGVEELLKEPELVLLEVGPGQTLSATIKQYAMNGSQPTAISTMRPAKAGLADDEFWLAALGQLWLAGVDIDWPQLYAYERRGRLPLPTYPFERQRYWIEAKPQGQAGVEPDSLFTRKPDLADWFYVPSWKRSPLPDDGAGQALMTEESCWLLFSDAGGLSAEVRRQLEKRGERVVDVRAGEAFAQISDQSYIINPRQRQDYSRLVHEIQALGKTPNTVLHLWNAGPPADATLAASQRLEDTQYLGFYSLIFLAQAIGEELFGDAIRISIVAEGLQDVTGEECLAPEKATLLGPCKVITLEYPTITCRSIDVMVPAPGSAYEERLAMQLCDEAAANLSDPVVAYRGAYRWAQVFEPQRYSAEAARPPRLRDGGVYLLTGGLREIDLALAESLGESVRARLVLTGQTDFPERASWPDWLTTQPPEDETGQRIRRLLALEAAGAEVMVANARVEDAEQMQAVIARAADRFGTIHGVLHTAEINSGGLVQLKTPEMAEPVLAPKVQGTLVIDQVLDKTPLDFFALFSSTLAISGVFGQVDYCAANAFLDLFARARRARGGPLTVAINWNTPQWEDWQEAAMSAVPQLQEQLRQTREMYGISYADGFEALRRILARSEPQVIVATQDFQALIRQQSAATPSGLLGMLEGAPAVMARPGAAIAADYVAPASEIERITAQIWERLFGIERIGTQDDFFQLGGNSLLAIQLMSQLRKAFAVELPLSKLFETPTIAGLAVSIADSQARQRELAEIERLLQEIEGLSPDDLRSQLEQLQAGGDQQ
jgi:acyl transferase domain-containing protein/acyl carrier protein